MNNSNLKTESFFDQTTFTFSHIVWDASTLQAALVDSVLDYDPKSGRTNTSSADLLVNRVNELQLKVQWILETHVHADHLSAMGIAQVAGQYRQPAGRHDHPIDAADPRRVAGQHPPAAGRQGHAAGRPADRSGWRGWLGSG